MNNRAVCALTNKIADLGGLALDLFIVIRERIGGGHDGHADGDGEVAGADLIAELAHGLRLGPMKVMPAAAQASAKSGFSERKP